MIGTSSIKKESSDIKFSSKTNYYGTPTPTEIYVYSGLYDSNSNLVGFCAKTAQSTKEVEATEYKNYSPGTYKVEGVHEAIFPAPYYPSVAMDQSSTGWKTL